MSMRFINKNKKLYIKYENKCENILFMSKI